MYTSPEYKREAKVNQLSQWNPTPARTKTITAIATAAAAGTAAAATAAAFATAPLFFVFLLRKTENNKKDD